MLSILLIPVSGITQERETSRQKLNIYVDPRIELLAVVQFLSDYEERYGLISNYDFLYKRDVEHQFSQHKNHQVVKIFSKMSKKGFNYHVPPSTILYFSNPPELKIKIPIRNDLIKRAKGEKKILEFIDEIRNFAVETNFMSFFNNHKDVYTQIVENVKNEMEGIDYLGILTDYYGMSQNSFNIILVPLFEGNFGHRVENVNKTFDIFSICGSINVKDELPFFGQVNYFRHLVWHEFSHSFVNPITEEFKSSIQKYKSLYNPISKEMKKQAYGDWESCVNEHIIRAITTRLSYRERGKETGDRLLKSEKERSFIYIEPICKKLEEYEKNRDKYPTFTEFYPRIIEVFKELKDK